MFTTFDEHCAFIRKQIARKPDTVLMSTFSLYAGITADGKDWSEKFRNETRELMDSLEGHPSVHVLVGVPHYSSCRKPLPCEDCEDRYRDQIERLHCHVEHFCEFNWRYSFNFHMKCWLFIKNKRITGVAGGRNLNDSDWVDVTFPLQHNDCDKLLNHYRETFKQSKMITRGNLKQEITRQFNPPKKETYYARNR